MLIYRFIWVGNQIPMQHLHHIDKRLTMRNHTIYQLIGALICVVMAAPLLAFVLQPTGQPAALSSTPTATATHTIPTARIVSTPVLSPTVRLPMPTAIPTRQPATPTATAVISSTAATTESGTTELTASAYTPEVRDGPGGLPYPLRLSQLDYGAVGHFYYTDRATAFSMAQQAGFGWIRQQVHWRDIEDASGEYYWNELDNIVADANAQGLLVLLSVVRSPAWHTVDGSDGMPDDPAALANFLAAMTQHYQGQVHAIEVWNEQNLAHENGGTISLDDAGHYVEILAAAYQAIKAVDPQMIVVAGAPSPTATNIHTIAVPDIDYMRAMYSYKGGMMRDYFDIQAVHPIGTINPPDKLYPDEPNTAANGWNDHESFYFRHIENMRRVMEEAGLGQHQVWITEFGWATRNDSPGYEYGNQISFETQRDYIVAAMQRTYNEYPWVSNMFIWNLNFTVVQREYNVNPLHEQGSFSIVNEDWTPRPAYLGMQQFISAYGNAPR
jgi:hypothetical protein